jgi:hypothetical protein
MAVMGGSFGIVAYLRNNPVERSTIPATMVTGATGLARWPGWVRRTAAPPVPLGARRTLAKWN